MDWRIRETEQRGIKGWPEAKNLTWQKGYRFNKRIPCPLKGVDSINALSINKLP
jgi:hypothetical protein